MSNADFKNLLLIINGNAYNDLDNWKSFSLSDLESQKDELKVGGVYAIKAQNEEVLYIGKAKYLYDRLKSHLKATEKLETAPAWKQFFEYFDNNLIALYFPITTFSEGASEHARQILERMLQVKYSPLFNKIYGRGHKVIDDFEGFIKTLDR